MLEIASGVYTAPTMSAAVRDRVWAVLEKWRVGSRDDGAVMTWADAAAPGGQRVRVLGEPPLELVETPSVVLCRREDRSLTAELDVPF
jgi:CRISPR-associated protein Cas2